MGPWMMGGFGWAWFIPIFMVVFWGLVIWGIVVLVRYLIRNDASKQTYSALETLKMRYAKGDIDKTEYEERKEDLI
ncbi:MAG: SHOCT domain-containing protein [Candidatus Hermodarchaeota archaeon]